MEILNLGFFPHFVGTHSTTGFPPGRGSLETARYAGGKWLSPALRTHIGVVLERFLCHIINKLLNLAREKGGFGTG